MTYIWNLDPVAISLWGLDVRWYGIVYVAGFFITLWWLLKMWSRFSAQKISKDSLENLLFGVFLWGVIGGRLGEFLFFQPHILWENPTQIFKVWEGGMAIHGGILFAIGYIFWWAKKQKVSFFEITDCISIPLAFTLIFGRLANFINGELVGRATNSNWGVIFPHVDTLLRHPSQLYESGKNLIITAILLFVFFKIMKGKNKHPGLLTAIFITGYGILRFFIEFVREPSSMVGSFTTGQALCVGMFIVGISIFIGAVKYETKK